MKAEPLRLVDGGYEPCEPKEATHIRLHLPGPLPNRILPVMIGGTRAGTPNWTWNGSVEAPTVRPSVLTRGGWHVYRDGKLSRKMPTASSTHVGQLIALWLRSQ